MMNRKMMNCQWIMLSFFCLILENLAFGTLAHAKQCSYTLKKDSAQVMWTAFKTTEKVGVHGKFKHVQIQSPQVKSMAALLMGLSASVDQASVDTENAARDQTLVHFFFKKLKSFKASGKIKSISEVKQTLILSLKLNQKTQDIVMTYTLDDQDQIKATGIVDLLQFRAGSAVDALHQQCHALHQGPDGVSKTWTEVLLTLSGTIHKQCD